MADTVITPAVQDSGANAMGWAVAIVLVIGILFFGIFVWPGAARSTPATPTNTNPSVDLNVTLPEGVVPGTNTSGSGSTQGGGANNSGTQTQ